MRRPITVDELGVSYVERLREIGISLVDELAFTHPDELSRELGLSEGDARGLVRMAAESIGIRLRWLDEVEVGEAEWISTGSKALDGLIGGVEVGSITEFYGGAASGKTQICHQLCVNVQLPRGRGGLEAEALYVDCDGTFRPERVVEMAEALGLDPHEALRRIHVVAPKSVDEQFAAISLAKRLPSKVRLVVVDTVTNLFRAEYPEDLVERQWRLIEHVRDLEELAHRGVAVVLANQVVARPGEADVAPVGGAVLEAGLVRVRLMRLREGLRLARLENSAKRPEGEALFRVCREGVRDVVSR